MCKFPVCLEVAVHLFAGCCEDGMNILLLLHQFHVLTVIYTSFWIAKTFGSLCIRCYRIYDCLIKIINWTEAQYFHSKVAKTLKQQEQRWTRSRRNSAQDKVTGIPNAHTCFGCVVLVRQNSCSSEVILMFPDTVSIWLLPTFYYRNCFGVCQIFSLAVSQA